MNVLPGYISYFNFSSTFSDAALAAALPDLQSQLSNELKWYWGIDAYLDINGSGTPIYITDNAPSSGYLGYHTIDPNTYQPYGIIFAETTQNYGYYVTGVISHETIELLADQLLDTVNLYDYGNGTGVIVRQELCDPCEMSLYYEGPNGSVVSDFALPAWWVPGDPNPVDYLGVIPGPWQLASGGYTEYQYVQLGGWQQASADQAQQEMKKIAENYLKESEATAPRLELMRKLQAQALAHAASQAHPMQAAGATPAIAARGAGQVAQGARKAQVGGFDGRAERVSGPAQITVVKRRDIPQLNQGQFPQGPSREAQFGQGQAPRGQIVQPGQMPPQVLTGRAGDMRAH